MGKAEAGRRGRRPARHGVSNKASSRRGRGSQQHRRHPAPAACAALEAEQTGLMLANISSVQIVGVFSLTHSLHIQRQMFPSTTERRRRNRRLNERPEMAELLSEEQVIGPSMVAATERGTYAHTHTQAPLHAHRHTHTPFSSLVSSASLLRSDKGKRVANLSFDEGGFPQTELTWWACDLPVWESAGAQAGRDLNPPSVAPSSSFSSSPPLLHLLCASLFLTYCHTHIWLRSHGASVSVIAACHPYLSPCLSPSPSLCCCLSLLLRDILFSPFSPFLLFSIK